MKPVLYRYRDSESVIKAMEGYTPSEGWEPLYDQAAVDAAVEAERERCAKVCEEEAASISREGKGCHTGQYEYMSSGADRCVDAIRKGE